MNSALPIPVPSVSSSTVPLTVVLYGAAATHVVLAIFAIYERRTFKLPGTELLRIALGLWLPVMLIGHAITTRLEFELIGSPATYARIISNLWASNGEWQHMGLLAPGWMHGCLGLHFVLARRPLWSRVRFALFGAALLLPVLSALGFEPAVSTPAAFGARINSEIAKWDKVVRAAKIRIE